MTLADSTMLLITVLLAYSMALPLRAGLFSVAPAAFAAIGAYTCGLFMTNLGTGFALGTLVAVAGCMVIGALLCAPLARITGLYTAIATLAVLVVTQGVIASMKVTGGTIGLLGIPDGDTRPFLLVLIALSLGGWVWLDRSHAGRRFDAVGADPVLASVRGISVGRARAIALTLSAGTAAAAGAAYAHAFFVLTPEVFGFSFAIQIAAVAVVGGATHAFGPLAGGLLLGLVNIAMVDYANWGLAVNGIVMVAVVVLYPQGLAGPLRRLLRDRRFRNDTPDPRHGAPSDGQDDHERGQQGVGAAA
jgi:branched-chain amino acid transport system permease protein